MLTYKSLYALFKSYYYLLYLSWIPLIAKYFYHPHNQPYNIFLALTAVGIFIPTIIDLLKIINQLLRYFKKLQYILYMLCFIISCIIYGISTTLSKEYISLILKVSPDSYIDAIYWFSLYFSFIIVSSLIMLFFTAIPTLYLAITILIDSLLNLLYALYSPLGNFFTSQVNKISMNIREFFGFYNTMHFLCFIFTAILFIVISLSYIPISTINFVEKNSLYIIHYTSYFQNYNTCKNVDSNAYIKLLGDNQVSISPFKDKSLSLLITNNSTKNNFYTTTCN